MIEDEKEIVDDTREKNILLIRGGYDMKVSIKE